MVDSTHVKAGDSSRAAAIGEALLNLAKEWQDNQRKAGITPPPFSGVVRGAYGELALELGVRGLEIGGLEQPTDRVNQIVKELRGGLGDAVARIPSTGTGGPPSPTRA